MHAVRKILRTGTREAHQKVDDTFTRLNLAERGDYCVFLTAHALAFATLAQGWQRHDLVDFVPLRRLLSDDLKALEARDPLPPFETRVIGPLGVAYVIAGSHFGKNILLKRWSVSNDPAVLAAGSYLRSSALKAAWTRTLPILAKLSDTEAQHVVTEARQCFSLFQTCHDLALSRRAQYRMAKAAS